MIYTSTYDEFGGRGFNTVSISGDRGKKANYTGKCYSKLAPKKSFWKVYHSRLCEPSQEENERYYIEEYVKQVLLNLDPEEVYEELNGSILLCYEPAIDFCHRDLVAAWFELMLGVKVPEIKYRPENVLICSLDKNIAQDSIYEVNREDTIYGILKEWLRWSIEHNMDMHNYTSIRAAYLYNKALKLENDAALYHAKNMISPLDKEKYEEGNRIASDMMCKAKLYRFEADRQEQLEKEECKRESKIETYKQRLREFETYE